MRNKILFSLAMTVVLTTGCANDGSGPTGGTKQTVGTVIGAVGGGILGSQIGSGSGKTAATIGGTILGGFLGGYIGKGLDDNDKLMAERNAQRSLEHSRTGSTNSWRNPDTGRSGDFTVNRTLTGSSGLPCREYTTTVYIGGQRHKAFGKACRHRDGTWEIVSQEPRPEPA